MDLEMASFNEEKRAAPQREEVLYFYSSSLDPHAASMSAVLINFLLKKKIQESRPELCSNF